MRKRVCAGAGVFEKLVGVGAVFLLNLFVKGGALLRCRTIRPGVCRLKRGT